MRGLFSFGRAVEPAPSQYAVGPTQTGATTERQFTDLDALNAFCTEFLGVMPSRGRYQACYVPQTDQVAIPAPGAWPSEDERQQLDAHEWAHARGWRHNPNGYGTGSTSLPPKGLLGLGVQARSGQ